MSTILQVFVHSSIVAAQGTRLVSSGCLLSIDSLTCQGDSQAKQMNPPVGRHEVGSAASTHRFGLATRPASMKRQHQSSGIHAPLRLSCTARRAGTMLEVPLSPDASSRL